MSIDHVNLARLDLGLLIAFDALVRERHVTRAAQRIGLGQSATSHALSRLRRLFGDELFIRSGAQMMPTPRALALAPRVEAVLQALQSTILGAATFEAATASRTFRIGVSPSLEIALAPALLAAVRDQAPGVSLAMRTAAPDGLLAALDEGALDLALGGFENGAHHHRRRVLCDSDGYLCLFDPARTGLGPPLSLEDFLRTPQVTVLSNDHAARALDRRLRDMDLSRTVVLETHNVLAVPYIVSRAPVLAVLCRRTARICAETFGLGVSELPFELPLQKVAMVWHSSSEQDPGSAWLRALVSSAVPWRRLGGGGDPHPVAA